MILCAGEALIDMLPRETAGGEQAFAPYAGGSVFNTSIALGRLAVETGFYSGLSNDLFGDLLTETLSASSVDSSFAARSDRPTTLAFVKLTNGQASYLFYDENSAGRMLGTQDLPVLNDTISTVFFGGISLVFEPCAQAYEALLMREADRRVIMLDPNVRQSFIGEEQAFRDRIGRMMAKSDIVKVSDEDLAWLVGYEDQDRAASEVLGRGTKLLCVTQGADGVSGYCGDNIVRVAAQKVAVVDTVGAGDTFNAGLLAALHDANVLTKPKIAALDLDTITAALSLGVRAAAVTVSRAGANPPTRSELG